MSLPCSCLKRYKPSVFGIETDELSTVTTNPSRSPVDSLYAVERRPRFASEAVVALVVMALGPLHGSEFGRHGARLSLTPKDRRAVRLEPTTETGPVTSVPSARIPEA